MYLLTPNVKYVVKNKELGASPRLRQADGTPIFSPYKWDNDTVATFTRVAGKDEFGWGVPGERYEVDAPLYSRAWEDDYLEGFRKWRMAVFAPEDLEKNPRIVPVVFVFAGIGGDYSLNGIYVPHIVKDMDCICVAFEPHMHGERVLGKHNPNIWGEKRLEISLDYMEKKAYNLKSERYHLNDALFKEMIDEMAFNVHQITCMLCQRYQLPGVPPCIMLGFSLGAFYAYQLSLLTPHCIACIGGGGVPDITKFKGLFNLARTLPRRLVNILTTIVQWVPPLRLFAILALVIRRITKAPYQIRPMNPKADIHFVIGDVDPLLDSANIQEFFDTLPSQPKAHIIQGVGHTPGSSRDNMNALGRTMMELTKEYASRHR